MVLVDDENAIVLLRIVGAILTHRIRPIGRPALNVAGVLDPKVTVATPIGGVGPMAMPRAADPLFVSIATIVAFLVMVATRFVLDIAVTALVDEKQAIAPLAVLVGSMAIRVVRLQAFLTLRARLSSRSVLRPMSLIVTIAGPPPLPPLLPLILGPL